MVGMLGIIVCGTGNRLTYSLVIAESGIGGWNR